MCNGKIGELTVFGKVAKLNSVLIFNHEVRCKQRDEIKSLDQGHAAQVANLLHSLSSSMINVILAIDHDMNGMLYIILYNKWYLVAWKLFELAFHWKRNGVTSICIVKSSALYEIKIHGDTRNAISPLVVIFTCT